ncbi:MAG TPA: HD domain-containing phosphohydrolase [Anaerolineales bacterium]|nr:HD domain-containing phosphohydrolase [Anaerolineales bacterium]
MNLASKHGRKVSSRPLIRAEKKRSDPGASTPTEAALQEKVEDLRRMATVVSDSNDAVIMHDFDGKILAWNRGAKETYGYSEAEALGRNVRELVAEPDREAALALIQKIKEGKVVKSFELRRLTKDGRVLDVWLTTTLLSDESGKPVAIATTERDISERKRAEERSQRQVDYLAALHTVNTAIAGSVDLRLTLKIALEHVVAQLKADAADVLLLDLNTQTLDYAAGRGFRSSAIEHSNLRLGEGNAGRAALDRQTIHIPVLSAESRGFLRADLVPGEGFASYACVPLIAKGKVTGVLEVFFRTAHEAGPEWLEFLETMAGQVAIAVDSARLFDGLERSHLELSLAYDATIAGWSHALDLRDQDTEGHTQRVTELTVNLARRSGIGENELVQIRRGALLHDIGKMGVPDGILLKPGPLTDDEWVLMKKHPKFAYDMLSPIQYLHAALDIPYCHHEKWDGGGYPRGLKGEQIPLAARIFAVPDVWDALTSDRPYRKAWTKEKALEHVREQTGKHFEPKVVQTFLEEISQTEPA